MLRILLIILATCFFGGQVRAEEEITLVCVDCYGTSSFFPQVARLLFPHKKIRWIHIQTEIEIQANYSPSFDGSRHEYAEVLKCDPADVKCMSDLLEHLKKQPNLLRVIGGLETGAVQADWFNKGLGLPGNDPNTSDDRREKEAMQVALGDFAIPTLLSGDKEEILAFVKKLNVKEIVIKPNASSGAEMVQFISTRDPEALWAAVQGCLGKTDNYGHLIDKVVVQPAIKGPEYVVNTIAVDGKVTITAIWRYEKFRLPNGKLIYFVDRPGDLNGDLARELAPLATLVHHRLGNMNGPGHGEFVKDEATGKWFLFEQAARVGGAGMSMVDAEVWGTSHLHLFLMAIIDPERFAREIALFPRTKIKDAAVFTLIARKAGKFKDGAAAFLRKLQSAFFPAPYYAPKDGEAFGETVDLTSAPLTVNLVGEAGQVKNDARALIAAQSNETLFEFIAAKTWAGGCFDRLKSWAHRVRLYARFHRIHW